MDPDKVPRINIHGDLSAVDSRAFAGEGFELFLEQGESDVATMQEVLSALSELHEAHGGGPLVYFLESSGLLRAVPAALCHLYEFDKEPFQELLRSGGYLDGTQAVHHSFAVLSALFCESSGELYLRKGDEMLRFDPLTIDSSLRAQLPTEIDGADGVDLDEGNVQVYFADTPALSSLIRMAEFSSVPQCVNISINMLARLLEMRSDGWSVVRKDGEEVHPIFLPSP